MRRSSRRSTMGVSIHQSLDFTTTASTTRRSSVFIPPLDDSRNLVGNFTTKFSMSSFIKKVEDLTPQQRTAIENVGFGKLLQLSHHTLRKNVLVEWMERWDYEKRAFLLLDRELTITPLDVALILGLRGRGKPINFNVEESFSELEEEYGADSDTRKITLSSIERRLSSLGTSADEDFVRTFILFTFGALLFPNSNGKVDSRYLSFLDDISEVSNYAWGVAVVEDLFDWLSRKKEEQIKNMEGCLILLQIWSYEHLDIGRPNLLNEHMSFPRACRWESSRSNTPRHFITAKFNELQEDQVVWKLEPLAAELNIQIIKELLVAETDGNEVVTLQHLNTTSMKSTTTSVQCAGLPPKSFTQQVAMDVKLKENERGGKHRLQAECPESSNLTDTSVVTMDYPECTSSYGMQEVVEDQAVETAPNLKEDNYALKTQNSKLKKENIELRREIGELRKQLSLNLKENTDLRKGLKSANALLEEFERFMPEGFDDQPDVSPNNSL